MFAAIDPTTTDMVHLVVGINSTGSSPYLAQRLGTRAQSQSIQLHLDGFSGSFKDRTLEFYSTLLGGLVLHLWPAGIRPVLWIAFDDSWRLDELRHLLRTIRLELVDKTLDVVIKSASVEQISEEMLEICMNFRCTLCTTLATTERMIRCLEGAKDPIARPMSARSSYGVSVESLPFYERHSPWYILTNFALGLPFTCEDSMQRFETSEHYFQAHKCCNVEDFEIVKNAPTPREAFQLAKASNSLRWYWDMQCRCGRLFKEEVMLKALLLKFSADQGLENKRARYQLLSTGTCQLVERSFRDDYWGTGPEGKGLNRLGYLLERARRIIVKEEFQKRGLRFDDYYQEDESI